MNLVSYNSEDDSISINWMWLPTWVGQNAELLNRIEEELFKEFEHADVTNEVLHKMHLFVCKKVSDEVKIGGLYEWLKDIDKVL